jgi:hypothetical protein
MATHWTWTRAAEGEIKQQFTDRDGDQQNHFVLVLSAVEQSQMHNRLKLINEDHSGSDIFWYNAHPIRTGKR